MYIQVLREVQGSLFVTQLTYAFETNTCFFQAIEFTKMEAWGNFLNSEDFYPYASASFYLLNWYSAYNTCTIADALLLVNRNINPSNLSRASGNPVLVESKQAESPIQVVANLQNLSGKPGVLDTETSFRNFNFFEAKTAFEGMFERKVCYSRFFEKVESDLAFK